MSEQLTVVEHNSQTGEIIKREMNAAELKQAEKDKKTYQEIIAAEQAKAQAKADLLERLGITADEAKLLLS